MQDKSQVSPAFDYTTFSVQTSAKSVHEDGVVGDDVLDKRI